MAKRADASGQMKPKQPDGLPMTPRQYARAGRHAAYGVVPEWRLPTYRADKSLELPGRNGDPILQSRVDCAKCGSRGNKIDVRPNWKEQPTQSSLTGKQWR